jgi:uncharacterized protein YndB with AHSA1/START domain
MAEVKPKHEPIRQSVRVDCPIEQAFRLFTESFAQWWPLASYSISGEEAETCALEPWVGGRVWERTRSGEEREWGSVLAWDPPEHLTFTWHPGGPEDRRQIVDVDFQVEADGTRVTLIHTGWDAPGVATCTVRFSQFVSERMLVLV